MNKQIESKWYINTEDYMSFRYYLDNDGLWFNYKDLYKLLYISGRKAEGMYNDLYEGNKKIYKELDCVTQIVERIQFINLAGVKQIEQRNTERFGLLYKNINLLGQQLDLENPNVTNNIVFNSHVDMVLTEINSGEKDYDRLAFYAKSVCDSKEVQKLKCRGYDSEKEEIIEEFRNDIYDNDVEEISWNVVKRRNNDEFEETEKLYKKNRAENKESSCPSWLRYVVK